MLLIHSSVNGNLDCFHVLATMNNTSVNMAVQYLFETLLLIPLGIDTEVELIDYMIISIANFFE